MDNITFNENKPGEKDKYSWFHSNKVSRIQVSSKTVGPRNFRLCVCVCGGKFHEELSLKVFGVSAWEREKDWRWGLQNNDGYRVAQASE